MNERDMYYNSYGYGGFTPLNNMQNQMPPMLNNQIPNQPYTYNGLAPTMPINNHTNSQFNDINERVNRLERQVKRLDQRLTRLETPYANTTNNFNTEPDNNIYMM